MRKYILSLLNIEKNETLSVALLLAQSLFIGIFNGTFYLSSHTLFIDSYGEKGIPMAYLVSGGVGIILTLIYSKLQQKIKFSSLSKINLIFVVIAMAALALSYNFIEQKLVDYTQFVLFGPLFVLSIVSFWGVANRLYNLRQGKRLFGIIDSGIIFGIIISTGAIAATPYFLGFDVDFKKLLYFSFGCAAITTIIQFIISSKFSLDKTDKEIIIEAEEELSKDESGISILFSNKYVFQMATFAGLSMLIAFFVQYSFLLVMAKKYTNKVDFGSFLGAFTLVIMVFTFLLKAFVYSKLIKNYGLKVCLILLPILLVGFTAGAIGIGYGMGIEDTESSGFLFFFMIISLSKLFAQSLKEGIEISSFKLLYLTLKKKIRFIIQAQIDGTVNELSALVSGLCLVGLSALSFIGLVEISVVMLFALLIWLYVAFSLYKGYKESLASGLKTQKTTIERRTVVPISISLLNVLKSQKEKVDQNLIVSLYETDPVLFEKNLDTITEKIDASIFPYLTSKVFKHPNPEYIKVMDKIYKENSNEDIRNTASKFIEETNAIYKDIDYRKILSLSNSIKNIDRIIAAIAIRNNYDPKFNSVLLRLIKDPNTEVKKEVIKTCALIHKPEFSTLIIDYLADDELYSVSYSALKEYGKDCLEYLTQSYFKTNISDSSLITITELISFLESDISDNVLLEKLFSKNRFIMQKALIGIKARNIKPKSEKEKNNLINLLNEQLSIVAWNIGSLNAFETKYPDMKVSISAIEDDIEFSKSILFSILSVIYDSEYVKIVKNNIESGNPDSISYGIEMLDLFIDEHLKAKIFPLLDDSNMTEKIPALEDYFPIELFKTENIFDLILNRDSNYLSDWTKAAVIYEMKLEEVITNTFIAQLFNKKKIIRESTYYKISQKNNSLKETIINRLPIDEKITVIEEIQRISNQENTLMISDLIHLQEIVDDKLFKPMYWVNDISNVKATTIKNNEEKILQDSSLSYVLQKISDTKTSCKIIDDSYNNLKINDRIISVKYAMFNKIASISSFTDLLILNNRNSLVDNQNLF